MSVGKAALAALLASVAPGAMGATTGARMDLNVSVRIPHPGKPVVVGTLRSVTFTRRAWELHAALRNVSNADVWIGSRVPCTVGVSPNDHPHQNLLPARHASSPDPRSLYGCDPAKVGAAPVVATAHPALAAT